MTTETPIRRVTLPGRPWRRWALCTGLMVIVLAGSTAFYWYHNLQTYHLAVVQPGVLYRDGNRGVREFAHALTITGSKTVVSLIDDRELNDPGKPQFREEIDYCGTRGIRHIRIPVRLGGWPSGDDLKRFIAIVSDPANQPVLVHCAQGVRRTGMFVAAYQGSVLREPKNVVVDEIMTFRHQSHDIEDVRAFISDYDPVTQRLLSDHAASKE